MMTYSHSLETPVGGKCQEQTGWSHLSLLVHLEAKDILQSFLGEADDKVAVLNEGETDTDLLGTSDFTNLTNVSITQSE